MKRKKSLKLKLISVIAAIFLVFVVLISLIIEIVSQTYIKNYVKSELFVQQEKIESSLDLFFYDTLSVMNRIYDDSNVTTLMDVEKDNRYNEFLSYCNSLNVSKEIYKGFAFYYEKETYYSNDDIDLISMSLINKVILSDNYINYCGSYVIDNDIYLIFAKKVNHAYDENKVGAAFIYVNGENVSLILQRVSSIGFSFIISDNYVVSHVDKNYIGKTLIDNKIFNSNKNKDYTIETYNQKKSLITVSKLTSLLASYNFSFQIVTIQTYSSLFSTLENLVTSIIVLSIIMLLIGILIAFKVSKKIVSPIQLLSNKVNNYNLEGETYKICKDEIGQLEDSYNEMINHISKLMNQNIENMETKRKLELETLQMQINPHFLYNTLDSIAWMAKIKKQPEIEKIIMSLAKFFRLSLHKGDKFITIEEEVTLTKHYLEIEEFRFPEKFEVKYEIDDNIKELKTLKLILQPIVENAIKHGFIETEEKGLLIISAKLINKEIVFQIKDNGRGFIVPEDLLTKNEEKQKRPGGVGLINVNERIKIEYGEEYGVIINSKPSNGTIVIIKIPARF